MIQRSRRARAVGDAVRDADAAEAAAGDEQPGWRPSARSIACEPREMTDLVLRVGALPAIDAA